MRGGYVYPLYIPMFEQKVNNPARTKLTSNSETGMRREPL